MCVFHPRSSKASDRGYPPIPDVFVSEKINLAICPETGLESSNSQASVWRVFPVGTGRRLRDGRVALSAIRFDSLALRQVLGHFAFDQREPKRYHAFSFSGGVQRHGYPNRQRLQTDNLEPLHLWNTPASRPLVPIPGELDAESAGEIPGPQKLGTGGTRRLWILTLAACICKYSCFWEIGGNFADFGEVFGAGNGYRLLRIK